MNVRANDAFVGLITGAVAAGVATIIEAAIVTARLLSLGHIGGGFGSRFLLIVVIGGLIGALLGFFIGTLGRNRSGIAPQ